jgi:hypothetical protein
MLGTNIGFQPNPILTLHLRNKIIALKVSIRIIQLWDIKCSIFHG